MTNPSALQYYSSELDSQDPKVLTLMFQTAARGAAVARLPQGDAGELLFQAGGATQTQIDSFLDTEDEFLAATLDAPAIGVVKPGAVLIKTAMQVKKVLVYKVSACLAGGGQIGSFQAGPEIILDPLGGPQNGIAKGADGNLCIKFDFLGTGLDYNLSLLMVDVMYIPE